MLILLYYLQQKNTGIKPVSINESCSIETTTSLYHNSFPHVENYCEKLYWIVKSVSTKITPPFTCRYVNLRP